jgi:glyoxylase-like metal-dependent hydrolase (beta-lactamase superfamily II)
MQTFVHGGAEIAAFHDAKTGSWQYVVVDPASRPASARRSSASRPCGRTSTAFRTTSPRTGVSGTGCSGRGKTFRVGGLPVRVMFSPGHTLASITLVIGGNAFVHDTLMMPGAGTSRADFPGGDAHALYRSIRDILALPDETGIFVGHDYGPDGRDPHCFSTVAEQRADNIHVGGGRSEADFVALRQRRDATLPLPGLMLYALQVNIRGGRLPEPEADGHVFFRIPANRFVPPEEDR